MREDGEDFAEQQLNNILTSCIQIHDILTDDLFKNAAKLKAKYKISLADSIAVSQTVVNSAIIVTSDHHEFDAIDRDGTIKFLWIR